MGLLWHAGFYVALRTMAATSGAATAAAIVACCRKATGRDNNSSARSSKLSVRAVLGLQDLQRLKHVPGAVVFATTAAIAAAAAMHHVTAIIARHGAEMCAQGLFLACRVLQRRERCDFGIRFSNCSSKGRLLHQACCARPQQQS